MNSEYLVGGGVINTTNVSQLIVIQKYLCSFLRSCEFFVFAFSPFFALLTFILAFHSCPLMFHSFHCFLPSSFSVTHRILPPSTSTMQSRTAADTCNARLPECTAESQTEFVRLDSSFLPHSVQS